MSNFSDKVIAWHLKHGRKDLPWQHTTDPYFIWVSEIMLQQTQVTTVIPYYERFMSRFPSIADLAAASQDEVLHLWTGLGYYARGRNLHHAAQQVMNEHNGKFPDNFDDALNLKGIGRSTAGAILSFAFGQRHAIMDGNVKRVLSRAFGIEGWSGNKKVHDTLWELADKHTPSENVNIYTQAIMDFGATLCTRSKPVCDECPLKAECVAFQEQRIPELPTKKPKKKTPVKSCVMLIIQNEQGDVFLEQRPPTGIWGGLWTLPQYEDKAGLSEKVEEKVLNQYGIKLAQQTKGEAFRHTFSHYHLDIQPIVCVGEFSSDSIFEENSTWVNLQQPLKIGLPAPIKKLLESLA